MRELGLLEDLLAISGKHADRDGTRNASILVWGRLVTRFFARTRIFFFQCRQACDGTDHHRVCER